MILPSVITVRARRLYNKRSFLYEVEARGTTLVASRIKHSPDVGRYYGNAQYIGSTAVPTAWFPWLTDIEQAVID